jgi:hypothetical protein
MKFMGSPKSQLHQTMKFARWPDHASPLQTLESRTKIKIHLISAYQIVFKPKISRNNYILLYISN